MNFVARYRILESLGRGGMGEVFLADDTQLERKVAIKFLPDELQDDPVARGRFEREAKSAAALDHPFICKIYEVAQVDGRAGIVMEHVAGQTLESRLVEGALAPAEAIQIAVEMAEALTEAHAHRILHRDLKPANLMLTGQGHVKVMDFGLAKRMRDPGVSEGEESTAGNLTRTGTLLGTPAYMSPEQVRGESVDARSDIFAFGVVLFELLTGEHPFKRGTRSDTIAAILRDAPSRAGGSADPIDYAIFDKLLAKAPDARYQSFEEVSVEVRRLRDATSGSSGTLVESLAGTGPIGARRTPFVGREAETAELLHWLDRAAVGRGGIVLIGGEPGVGKTRLVEQLLEAALERRCLAVTGRCYEMEGTAPFSPFVELVEQYIRGTSSKVLRETLGDAASEVARLVPDLRRLFADIPPPLELPPDQQRHYLFKNFSEFLERVSGAATLVVLLDDLQWADDATLALLQHLAPQLAQRPVLMVGTYRDVELDVQRPFATTLETLNRKRLSHRLTLRRLPEAGVASMLTALGGPEPPSSLIARIFQETEGNAFFVEEVFQHLQEEGTLFGEDGRWRSDLDLEELEVPEGVRLVIGRRLERVSPDAQQVLTFGAVVGRSFSLKLLEAIGDVTGDALLTALEEAERDYLIVPTAGRQARWEFSHALIRQTLSAGLSLPRRQRLHLRVADAIEQTSTAIEARVSEVAHHLYQAGEAADAERTAGYLRRAGDQALDTGAMEEAHRHYEHGLSLEADLDAATRAGLLYGRGRALQSLYQADRALEDWHEAAALFENAGNLDQEVAVCWDYAFLCIWRGEYDRAMSMVRPVLARAGEEVGAGRCLLVATAGATLACGGESDESDAMFARAIEQAESLGDDRLLGQVLSHRAASLWATGHGREWVEAVAQSGALLRAAGDLPAWVNLMGWDGLGRWYAGEPEHLEEATEAEAVADRLGELSAGQMIRMARALFDLGRTGDLDQFEAFARSYLEWNLRVGNPWKMVAASWLGLLAFWRGRWDEARDELARSRRFELECPDGHTAWSAWSNVVMAKAYAGDEDTLALLREHRDMLPTPGSRNTNGAWGLLFKAVEAFSLLGEREAAAELYPLTQEAIATGTLAEFMTITLYQTGAGTAAAAGGQWDVAEEHYQTALRQAHELPRLIDQPEIRRWYARMLLDRNASGDRDKARTLLGEAVKMYEAIDMPRHLELAREMLKGM